MKASIMLGDKEIVIAATLKAMVLYKRQFGEEYLDSFTEINESDSTEKQAEDITITGFRLLWAMVAAADDSTPLPNKWLAERGSVKENFTTALTEAQALFYTSIRSGKPGNSSGEKRVRITTEQFLSAALKAGIGYNDALEMTIGELNAVLEEYIRPPKKKENVRMATQADFDRF